MDMIKTLAAELDLRSSFVEKTFQSFPTASEGRSG